MNMEDKLLIFFGIDLNDTVLRLQCRSDFPTKDQPIQNTQFALSRKYLGGSITV